LNFPDEFSKSIQISHFTKLRPVATELFHTDRQTDQRYDEAISRFLEILWRRLKTAQKNQIIIWNLQVPLI